MNLAGPGVGDRVALWLRVSTGDQDLTVQEDALVAWAAARGLQVIRRYHVTGSAWRGSHHPQLRELMRDASHGDFDRVMVALDRLHRGGPADLVRAWQALDGYGVRLMSLREPFIEESAAFGSALRELLVMILGWLAREESELISRRTRAGLERRRRQGLPVGRQPGAKYRRPRRTAGYHRRRGGRSGRSAPG